MSTENYPIGTLVEHYHHTQLKVGIVTAYTKQMYPKMIVHWFISGHRSSSQRWELINLSENCCDV